MGREGKGKKRETKGKKRGKERDRREGKDEGIEGERKKEKSGEKEGNAGIYPSLDKKLKIYKGGLRTPSPSTYVRP